MSPTVRKIKAKDLKESSGPKAAIFDTVVDTIKGLESDELVGLCLLLQDKEKTRNVLKTINLENAEIREFTTYQHAEMTGKIDELETRLAETKKLLDKAIKTI